MKGNPIRHIDHQTCQETIPDIPPDFSFRAFSSRPHTYPDGNFPWHWHRELEWFYVTDGELSCHLAQGIFVFRTGEGGFFNTNVLHKISCPVGTVCVHEVLQFPAEFVAPPGSRIQENYVFPIVENTELPIFKFDPQVPAHWPALDLLRKAYSVFRARLPGYEMDVQALVLQLWKDWTRIRTNNVIERLNREIRRRTRVVGSFPDGNSALMLVCARLRHVAGTQWGNKKYMNMKHLEAAIEDASIAG